MKKFWEGHENLKKKISQSIWCSKKLGDFFSHFCGLLRISKLYQYWFYEIFLSAMALVGGSMASKDIPAGLRVSFTESNISAERKKVEENKKMEVAGNNEPLY